MYRLIFLLLFVCSFRASAQVSDTLYNQSDTRGKRHGQWILRYPAAMGEDAYAEWGTYDHGVKWGVWYRFDGDAEVTAIEHYRAGVRDGEAKYFERGRLVATGNYRGLNPQYEYDTLWVYDPSRDIEVKRIIPSERGSVKQGLWRYYDSENGRLVREVDFVLDEPVAKQEFTVPKTDSSWYKRNQQFVEYQKKHPYNPPRDKQFHYSDYR